MFKRHDVFNITNHLHLYALLGFVFNARRIRLHLHLGHTQMQNKPLHDYQKRYVCLASKPVIHTYTKGSLNC